VLADDAQPRVRADGRKRASLACGALLATLVGRRSTRALGPGEVPNVSCALSGWQLHASPALQAPKQCAQVLCRVNARCRSMPRSAAPARPSVSLSADAVASAMCFTQPSPSVTRLAKASATRGVVITVPNPAFERTAASALRLLAVPSSRGSSAAAQRERWASGAAPGHA
jgi:hypothetical protein